MLRDDFSEVERLLRQRKNQATADYKMAFIQYIQTVSRAYRDPEKVSAYFENLVKFKGVDYACEKLNRVIFNYGKIRGHFLSKEGWTIEGVALRQGSREAREIMPDHYRKLREAENNVRVADQALNRHQYQNVWRDIQPANDTNITERQQLARHEPSLSPTQDQPQVASEHRPRLERVISLNHTREDNLKEMEQDIAGGKAWPDNPTPEPVPDKDGRPVHPNQAKREEEKRLKEEIEELVRERGRYS